MAELLPDEDLLREGVVSKYLIHHIPVEGFPASDIRYERYSLTGDNQLSIQIFNAAYELITERILDVATDSVKLLSEKNYWPEDTVLLNISASAYLILKDSAVAIHATNFSQPFKEDRTVRRTFEKDSMSDGQTFSVFFEDMERTVKHGGTSYQYSRKGKIIYAHGLGMIAGHAKSDQHHFEFELVEQMSEAEFQRRAHPRRRRIAYIDPAETMDKESDFTLCHGEEAIKDYYNDDGNAQHGTGKREMLQILKGLIDPAKIFGESGYLTFRFVVNCQGKAGRYITEESDLSFRRKRFKEETRTHLFEVVRSLQNWKPVVLEKPEDAYFYLTFKLQDGKVVDILP